MEDLLIKAVRRLGVATSQELQRELGISQPTFSRLALRAAGQIAVLGRGRSTRYSLPRNVRGLGSEFPVLEIDASGNASQITRLRPIEGGRWWGRDPITREERLFGGFPYFLSDMRPQGFMGRAFPRRFAELELPERVADWSDDDVLLALARRGEDGMGNLIVGAESSQRYLLGKFSLNEKILSLFENIDRIFPWNAIHQNAPNAFILSTQAWQHPGSRREGPPTTLITSLNRKACVSCKPCACRSKFETSIFNRESDSDEGKL